MNTSQIWEDLVPKCRLDGDFVGREKRKKKKEKI